MTDTKFVFNASKTADEYVSDSGLFFGEVPGLFDTVNKRYPKIWNLYKEMKALDWDEGEFDYTQCNVDFKTTNPEIARMMRVTLGYQWEADTVASRAIAPVLAPFITSSELWALWQRISDNEVVHAATYSEIVRMSFDNPQLVLGEILAVSETISRMDTVNAALAELYVASHKWALRQIPYSQDLYNTLYKGIVALLLMERIQFMASFAVTFTIAASGPFQPIGMAVKKICQDELEIHVQTDKEVLAIEHQTERGQRARIETADEVTRMFNAVIESEFRFVDFLFKDGGSLLGTTPSDLKKWVLFNAKDPFSVLNIKETPHKFPSENPQKHLESWINMNKTQAAPQEQDNAAYKVGVVSRDAERRVYDVDF